MTDELRIDPYIALAAGVQAMRRHVEAADAALGGALGVAAEPYPHQIAAVRRVLTDTRIRHLIADEVGLGKTVQALMILNALRWQNPRHKAVVLVPNRLIDQWRKECWGRGHCKVSVFGDDPEDDRESWVRIVRPQSIQSGAFRLQPDRLDLLVVDEPQLMPVDVMDIVERSAADFRQLLILSATPGLGDPVRRRRLLAMLEPERAALAEAGGLDILDYIDSLDRGAGNGRSPPTDPQVLYQAFSSERRIMRATRAEWGRYLPGRHYERLDVAPLAGERERVSLGMEWLESVRQTGAKTDVWRAAQVLHRGTTSVRALASGQNDPQGLLTRAVAASAETPGDSRLDALLDVLGQIWNENDAQQVVVVAGDNPTIDYLKSRLPRYFHFDGVPVGVTELRREGETSESEEADIKSMDQQLTEFTSGRSKVLLLGEWVQAGLNLHYYARHIVFYTTPWACEAVDQLVGRLDRLRPNGLWKGDKGKHFGNIRIWSINQQGTPEQRVMSGLEALKVFDRPMPPVAPDDARVIDRELKSLIFGNDGEALERLTRTAQGWDDGGSRSTLSHLSPFTAAAAQAAYERLQARSLPGPLLRSRAEGESFTSACEKALRAWLDFIGRSETFAIGHERDRRDPDVKFMTIWYRSREARYQPFEISGVDGANSISGKIPFTTARGRLGQPLRMTVVCDAGEEGGRPLRFLDHGDEVHDALVAGFLSTAMTVCRPDRLAAVQVAFDPRHPLLEGCSGKILMLAAAYFDPGQAGMPEFDRGPLSGIAASAPTEAQRANLIADIQITNDWWQADQRWVWANFPSLSYYSAARLEGAKWVALPEDVASHAFMPIPEGRESRCARVRGPTPKVPEEVAKLGSRFAGGRINLAFQTDRNAAISGFCSELARRMQLVAVESDDFVSARQAELDRLHNELSAVQEWAREGRIAAARRSLDMARAMVAARRLWLSGIPDRLRETGPTAVGTMIMRPAPFADES